MSQPTIQTRPATRASKARTPTLRVASAREPRAFGLLAAGLALGVAALVVRAQATHAPLPASLDAPALAAAGRVAGDAYVNGEAGLELRLPGAGWRRLDYGDEGLVRFAPRAGHGCLTLHLEEAGADLEEAARARHPARIGEGIEGAGLEVRALSFAGQRALRTACRYRAEGVLGALALELCREEVWLPWRGRALRLAWIGAEPLGEPAWREVEGGLSLDVAAARERARGARPLRRLEPEALLAAWRSAGKVSAGRYRNQTLGVSLALPRGARCALKRGLLEAEVEGGGLCLAVRTLPAGVSTDDVARAFLAAARLPGTPLVARTAQGRRATSFHYEARLGGLLAHHYHLVVRDGDRVYQLSLVSRAADDLGFEALVAGLRLE